MSENVQPAPEQARQIIRNWLTAQNRSLRNLAQEAGIQPSIISRFLKEETTLDSSSALKLYSAMQKSMNFPERKSFVEALGLLPLATAFSRDALFTIDMNAPPYEVGSRLMVAAFDRFDHAAFEEAIALFRQAEEVWGRSSSQAALAGCMIAQMYLNLGDYHRAHAEALYIQTTYGDVMDAATRAELCRIRHWIDYYQGNYEQSAQALQERITIAEEAGIPSQKNPHFLGRIYYDLSCQSPRQEERATLFRKAEHCFDESHELHLHWGDDHNQAFDLFRKAQALAQQHKWYDAQKLRTKARAMFTDHTVGGGIALLHFELEDAKRLLKEGAMDLSKHKTEQVVHGWAHVKYPKGIADSLKVFSDLAYMQGSLEQVLEILVARLCLYPYENYPSTRQVWDEVHSLRREILRCEGRKSYQEMLQRIQDVAAHHQGYFSYLDAIAADRSTDMVRVLTKLQVSST